MLRRQVKVVETAMVSPSKETPRQALWLSNLDLAMPRKHTPVVYYYPASAPVHSAGMGMGCFAPERMKAALGRALVPFYPLAGRLGVGADGRLQIDCTGDGALFVVTRADDLAGEEIFDEYEPSPEVTFLKCGGVVLGTGIHHAVTDGVGAFHFIQTWAGLARGLDVADACSRRLPFHDRRALHARCQPSSTSCDDHHLVYSPAFLSGGRAARRFVTRAYPVSPRLLADLKSRYGAGVSTYCAVTAHLWRCVCVARGVAAAPGSHTTRLGIPANVRGRLSPPLPPGFFGNVVVRHLVTARASDVLDTSLLGLWLMAETIKKAVLD